VSGRPRGRRDRSKRPTALERQPEFGALQGVEQTGQRLRPIIRIHDDRNWHTRSHSRLSQSTVASMTRLRLCRSGRGSAAGCHVRSATDRRLPARPPLEHSDFAPRQTAPRLPSRPSSPRQRDKLHLAARFAIGRIRRPAAADRVHDALPRQGVVYLFANAGSASTVRAGADNEAKCLRHESRDRNHTSREIDRVADCLPTDRDELLYAERNQFFHRRCDDRRAGSDTVQHADRLRFVFNICSSPRKPSTLTVR